MHHELLYYSQCILSSIVIDFVLLALPLGMRLESENLFQHSRMLGVYGSVESEAEIIKMRYLFLR